MLDEHNDHWFAVDVLQAPYCSNPFDTICNVWGVEEPSIYNALQLTYMYVLTLKIFSHAAHHKKWNPAVRFIISIFDACILYTLGGFLLTFYTRVGRMTTPMRKLIKKMPDLAEIVYNQCITDNGKKPEDDNYKVRCIFCMRHSSPSCFQTISWSSDPVPWIVYLCDFHHSACCKSCKGIFS